MKEKAFKNSNVSRKLLFGLTASLLFTGCSSNHQRNNFTDNNQKQIESSIDTSKRKNHKKNHYEEMKGDFDSGFIVKTKEKGNLIEKKKEITYQKGAHTLSIRDYHGNSIVDALNSIGYDSSFSSRSKLAKKYGIKNYKGTARQNINLLKKLKKDNFNYKKKVKTKKKKYKKAELVSVIVSSEIVKPTPEPTKKPQPTRNPFPTRIPRPIVWPTTSPSPTATVIPPATVIPGVTASPLPTGTVIPPATVIPGVTASPLPTGTVIPPATIVPTGKPVPVVTAKPTEAPVRTTAPAETARPTVVPTATATPAGTIVPPATVTPGVTVPPATTAPVTSPSPSPTAPVTSPSPSPTAPVTSPSPSPTAPVTSPSPTETPEPCQHGIYDKIDQTAGDDEYCYHLSYICTECGETISMDTDANKHNFVEYDNRPYDWYKECSKCFYTIDLPQNELANLILKNMMAKISKTEIIFPKRDSFTSCLEKSPKTYIKRK